MYFRYIYIHYNERTYERTNMDGFTALRSFDVVLTETEYEVYGDPKHASFALYHAPLAIRAYDVRALPGRYKVTVYRNDYDMRFHYIFQRYV